MARHRDIIEDTDGSAFISAVVYWIPENLQLTEV